ncbi:response regulator transcription factor [Anaerofustis stercorihominis]|uniref:Stage 0 sporulation protein A homolog n=2 Tax=Anaerofustis stercorihominis TaxID=214853 RepID=B1CBS0_9FIRM|nr:response regulator transcription factor [Anaerofustis stercorihominis]EDS71717.1 response regulator receiver domain protein [Anaerofustis stercorihominis DSM 17244]MCQ4796226.1 response regulator transcription factor [Anaerofustis stercorihominis]RGD75213.1 DNA-binding response regulator [Anaerofustis stercorihominis]
MGKYNILVVDDDKEIVKAINIYLSNEGYNIFEAYDGYEALSVLEKEEIHLIVLDIMMPKLDGIATITKVREKQNVPVIFLSAKSEDTDKIIGLNIGADDYVTKPFNPLELIARVKSLIRRYTILGNMSEKEADNILTTGGLSLNEDTTEVTVDGEEVKLTSTEFKILKLLMSRPNKVFSMEEIYEKVWGELSYMTDNTVAVHVRHIREKIEIDPKNPKYLKVVWGIGYKIEKH